MAKVVITQVKSAIDRPKRQKATIEALGIKKLNVSVEKELNSPTSRRIDFLSSNCAMVKKGIKNNIVNNNFTCKISVHIDCHQIQHSYHI